MVSILSSVSNIKPQVDLAVWKGEHKSHKIICIFGFLTLIDRMQEVISLAGIKKSYFLGRQELPVLKGIDLIINRNEYVSLMGPSGSGKSTLMNIIGCLDTPTSGKYILNEKDVSSMG